MNASHDQLDVISTIVSRQSVRDFDRNAVIPDQDLTEILTVASKAPSAWNLQHWRYLVIRERESKDRLLPIAYHQQQVSDASAVILVLGDLQANLSAPDVFATASPEVRDMIVQQVEGAYTNIPLFARDEAIRNPSFAAMQLMLAAKAKGYDTVPMGGFDSATVKKEFKIPDRYVPVVMIALGKAAAPTRATERFTLDQLVTYESF